jgi:hypothetical protein
MDDLPALLIALRGERSQIAAARLTGLTQSKISRAETGRFPLSPAEAEAFARGLDAPEADRARLVALAEAHHADNVVGRKQLVASAHVIQRRIADLLASTRSLRSWQPDLLPGILQTEPYTRAVIGFDPDERWWVSRGQQRDILDDPQRGVHLVVAESALRWGLGSAAVMRDQLAHLATAARRPPLRLGIVPTDRVHPVAPPRGFSVYGESTASVATDVGTTFVGQPDVQMFLDQHAAVAELAVYGDDAAALLQRVADTVYPA